MYIRCSSAFPCVGAAADFHDASARWSQGSKVALAAKHPAPKSISLRSLGADSDSVQNLMVGEDCLSYSRRYAVFIWAGSAEIV